jgi:hypothetical protein
VSAWADPARIRAGFTCPSRSARGVPAKGLMRLPPRRATTAW